MVPQWVSYLKLVHEKGILEALPLPKKNSLPNSPNTLQPGHTCDHTGMTRLLQVSSGLLPAELNDCLAACDGTESRWGHWTSVATTFKKKQK